MALSSHSSYGKKKWNKGDTSKARPAPNKPNKYNRINIGFGDTTYHLLCAFLMYKKKQDIEKYQLL